MAYVAVKGGENAIEASIELLKTFQNAETDISVSAIRDNLSMLVDKIMSEAGLYAPDYAALALKQCDGNVEEAVFLLRAYRSTLERNHYSNEINGKDMRLIRRISSAFKDIPGGQILGPTYDYSHRLLDFSLLDGNASIEDTEDSLEPSQDIISERISDIFRAEGVLKGCDQDDTHPTDITSHLLTHPADRSARLQTLARADGGFLGGVAYSAMRGYGAVHPTIAELRSGYVDICVTYPFDENEEIVIGEILLTEVESLMPKAEEQSFQDENVGKAPSYDKMTLSGGYGLAFGRNENKAISMSIVDANLDTEGDTPSQDEEFVLIHGDSLEMNGFISHLKLPHYVSFQSSLDVVRKSGEKDE
jgi:Uncharacterized enzyme of phosphonate metabolism